MTRSFPRRALLAGPAALSLCALMPRGLQASEAQAILAASDALRNPQTAFAAHLTLTDFRAGAETARMQLALHSKPRPGDGQYRSILRIEAPARDAGKLMLRDGRELYFYDPAAANTIRISPQQRLLGQASNGDVMTVNFARDYDSSLAGRDTVQDAGKRDRTCHRLHLRAATPAALYRSIDFWIEEGTMRPVKGRFYAASGKLMKLAFYSDFRAALGADRPMRVAIVDGLDPARVTVMALSGFRQVDLPDAWFQPAQLPHFRAP